MNKLEKILEPEQMPCCPFCDNAINDFDGSTIFSAHRCKALAHAYCADEYIQSEDADPVDKQDIDEEMDSWILPNELDSD